MYAEGTRVQAVDELGRWESARIVKLQDGQVTVRFPGWSIDFDREVTEEEIRLPVAFNNLINGKLLTSCIIYQAIFEICMVKLFFLGPVCMNIITLCISNYWRKLVLTQK